MLPDHTARFGSLGRLLGAEALEILARAHVAVIGVGGVGSWTVEALARSGVGALTLIDQDDVCVTNVNRQVLALESTVGHPKVEVLTRRIREIHPGCRVTAICEFFTAATASRLLDTRYDFVVDATDRMSIKALVLDGCRQRGLPALTIGAAGGKRDLTRIQTADLGLSGADDLLRLVRRKLRRSHGWERGEGHHYGVPAIFSTEPPAYPWSDGQICSEPEPGSNLKMDCATGFGAACFVTGTFGFAAAAEVVARLTGAIQLPPKSRSKLSRTRATRSAGGTPVVSASPS